MTLALKPKPTFGQTTATDHDVKAHIAQLGAQAKAAARQLATATDVAKSAALNAAAKALLARSGELLAANAQDLLGLEGRDMTAAFIDRLTLTEAGIHAMADAMVAIAAQDDPVGRVLARFDRPNGLVIERVSVPIGVIAMIYESRPNVGADAGALCLKSGNAVILRGGSESLHSSRVIVNCLRIGLVAAGLPEAAVQMVDTPARSAVTELLRAVDTVDLAIPRGGRGLVSLVQREARVPTLLHLEGNNHTYVHAEADIAQALQIVQNAKMRRTGICGATECVVIDRAIAPDFLPKLARVLDGCVLRGDAQARAILPEMDAATEADWDTEYLDNILSVKLVADLTEAIYFVQAHSSGHTDAIVTIDQAAARVIGSHGFPISSAVMISFVKTVFRISMIRLSV
jgi:glutamate-5-semialdehyde dehydrogenase